VEEICSHVLILKNGRKILDGSMDEVRRQFGDDVRLEDAFIRATEDPPA
jgi:ABC-2 type transport system ATP-binding protein